MSSYHVQQIVERDAAEPALSLEAWRLSGPGVNRVFFGEAGRVDAEHEAAQLNQGLIGLVRKFAVTTGA